jgi:hypothetical protein
MAVAGATPDAKLDITGMNDMEALEQIGQLINSSQDTLSVPGTDRAFAQLDELKRRSIAPKLAALAHYFRANAWDNKLKIAHYNPWAWEQTERQEQILELRRAMKHEGFDKLHPMHQCQIFTKPWE